MAKEAKERREIEITPEMIRAGVDVLWDFDLMHPTEDELQKAVGAVYRAMSIAVSSSAYTILQRSARVAAKQF